MSKPVMLFLIYDICFWFNYYSECVSHTGSSQLLHSIVACVGDMCLGSG
jgi:hypothetical protein